MKKFDQFIQQVDGLAVNENLKHDSEVNLKMLEALMGHIRDKYDGTINKRHYAEKTFEDDDEDPSYNYYHYNLTFTLDDEDMTLKYNKVPFDKLFEIFKNQTDKFIKIRNILFDIKINEGSIYITKEGDRYEIMIELFNDYFDENKDLLKSITGIKKYNL